jgi:hypothetical protein
MSDRYDEMAEKVYNHLATRWETGYDLVKPIAKVLREAAQSSAKQDALKDKVVEVASLVDQFEYPISKPKTNTMDVLHEALSALRGSKP